MVEGGLRWMGLGLLAIVVASCGGSSSPATTSSGPIQPAPPSPAADLCGAGELQWLVGRSRTDIPVPVNFDSRRVTCTTCPLTEDYSESRLNILFNRETALIERVYCG